MRRSYTEGVDNLMNTRDVAGESPPQDGLNNSGFLSSSPKNTEDLADYAKNSD